MYWWDSVKSAVEIACALAACIYNDGLTSVRVISQNIGLQPSKRYDASLRSKDIHRVQKSDYKITDYYKKLRRSSRAKRKGYEDKCEDTEGVVYSAGAFDGAFSDAHSDVESNSESDSEPDTDPGPSKRRKTS